MKNTILKLVALCMLIPTLLSAGDLSKSSIVKFMEVSGASAQFEAIPDITYKMLKAQGGMPQDKMSKVKDALEKIMAPHYFTDAISKAFLESDMTQSELNLGIKFYESDLGKKVAKGDVSVSTLEGMQAVMTQQPTNDVRKAKILDKLLNAIYDVSKFDTQTLAVSKATYTYAYKDLSNDELEEYLKAVTTNKALKKAIDIGTNAINVVSAKQQALFQKELMDIIYNK